MTQYVVKDSVLYIFWSLHQTTTYRKLMIYFARCISFDPYIKPQLTFMRVCNLCVVYLLIPTSNHNSHFLHPYLRRLYIFWSLHQTTTTFRHMGDMVWLYIFWSLHQTTTLKLIRVKLFRCISFDPYIKPQLYDAVEQIYKVVYLLIPTSNHNCAKRCRKGSTVVYLLIPTSNHNASRAAREWGGVVYLLIPTSNHNRKKTKCVLKSVVYLLIPTSNHNFAKGI